MPIANAKVHDAHPLTRVMMRKEGVEIVSLHRRNPKDVRRGGTGSVGLLRSTFPTVVHDTKPIRQAQGQPAEPANGRLRLGFSF